jgi:uncharacterized protein YdhG (YjbR/CyaY superfamily)
LAEHSNEDSLMKSSAAEVQDYVDNVDADWRPIVQQLRALCKEHLTGYQETMTYGMPTYKLNGRPEAAFARQVKYFSLYIMKEEVLDAHRPDLRGLSLGKGCVRYRRPDQIDWAVVRTLLKETNASAARAC